jgi:hypothetical protein
MIPWLRLYYRLYCCQVLHHAIHSVLVNQQSNLLIIKLLSQDIALWPKRPPDPGEGAHQAAAREAEEATKDAARDQARSQLVARMTELPADPPQRGP